MSNGADTAIYAAFSASNEAESKLIRAFTGGDVSHAFLLFFDPVLECWVTLGANANGLTLETLEDFTAPILYIYGAPGLSKGLRQYRDWINRPYDYAALIGMAEVEAQERLFKHIAANPCLTAGRLFCSEYVTYVVRASGYAILSAYQPGSVDPNTLRAALVADEAFAPFELKALTGNR